MNLDIHLTVRELADRGTPHGDVQTLDHIGRQLAIGVAGKYHQTVVGHGSVAFL